MKQSSAICALAGIAVAIAISVTLEKDPGVWIAIGAAVGLVLGGAVGRGRSLKV
ncbi:MAG: hypothetical protein ACREQR_13700 [Candidatus Binataceae bacterium]